MTIQGVALLGPDRAVMWTDTEEWTRGPKPSGYRPKLTVNPLISAAGCGTGFVRIIDAADRTVLASADADEMIFDISKALRNATAKDSWVFDADPVHGAGLRYLLAVWSPRSARMLAWQFDIENFFAPVLASQSLSPPVDVPICWEPQANDVLAVARKQIASLRKSHRGAGELGALTLADVQQHAVHAYSIPDFDADFSTREDSEKDFHHDQQFDAANKLPACAADLHSYEGQASR